MSYSTLSAICVAVAVSTLSFATGGCAYDAGDLNHDGEALDPGGEAIGEAAQAVTYGCTLGVDCNVPAVSLLSTVNGSTYRIDMGSGPYRRLDLFASVCSPTGWSLHLTDSPTANGYGGDAASTDHDAEGYLLGAETFQFFSAFDMARNQPGARVINSSAFPGGCHTVRMTAFHPANLPDSSASTFQFVGDASIPATTTDVYSPYGMKIGYAACASPSSPQRSIECDYEDSSLGDQSYWYIGINRTVGSPFRSGTGVKSACIVLSSNVSVTPTDCLP